MMKMENMVNMAVFLMSWLNAMRSVVNMLANMVSMLTQQTMT